LSKGGRGVGTGQQHLLFHLLIPLNPAYVKEKMNHHVEKVEEVKEGEAFWSSFFDLFDVAVKNSSNSGNFTAIGK
jgi:hypothetical protein